MRKRYFFFTSFYFDKREFFAVRIDGQMFKATNGQFYGRGPICMLEHIGPWTETQDGFIEKGTWKRITPEEARDRIPDGYRSNFPFPQLLKKA